MVACLEKLRRVRGGSDTSPRMEGDLKEKIESRRRRDPTVIDFLAGGGGAHEDSLGRTKKNPPGGQRRIKKTPAGVQGRTKKNPPGILKNSKIKKVDTVVPVSNKYELLESDEEENIQEE